MGAAERFQPDWESLRQYQCPEWFRDAKFGLYAHWGPYSAAGGSRNTDWYSRNMYLRGHRHHADHLRQHGPVEKVGYKDLIPLFTAEKFNADEWVDLYVQAGARFAGPVAEHSDGFAMWDSQVTPWNAKAMGPKRDVVAEMERAVRRRGLKFLASLHHHWKWGWYPTWDAQLDCSDPAYAGLYGPTLPATAWGAAGAGKKVDVMQPNPPPDGRFAAEWLAKVKEVVTGYRPDLLWFDNRMQILPEAVRREMVAFYYNQAEEWQRPVVLTYKTPDLPEGTATIDLERSRMPDIRPEPWLTDSSIAASSWSYATDLEYYSADRLIDDLVDIVSKNGCLLLNIAPAPDGTIPDEQKDRLRRIGAWLSVNGEAIYGSRPWRIYGEGPTLTLQGHLADLRFQGFTPQDIRYTQSKDGGTIFAILLGWPDRPDVTLGALALGAGAPVVADVRLLGHDGAVAWRQTPAGLQLRLPEVAPAHEAVAFKLTVKSAR